VPNGWEPGEKRLCRVSPQQLLDWGRILGVNSTAKIFHMWKWDDPGMTADNTIVAAILEALEILQDELHGQIRPSLKSVPRA
jgi:hypothetical protein